MLYGPVSRTKSRLIWGPAQVAGGRVAARIKPRPWGGERAFSPFFAVFSRVFGLLFYGGCF